MVLRDNSVRVRLQRLEEVISTLERLRQEVGEARTDLRQMWAVERGLQLGAEIILDIGNHILSAHYGISPADHKDVIHQLARQGVLNQSVAARLEGLAGFRNILVHDYIRLEPEKVLAAFERAPRDFSEFAMEIRSWLEGLAQP